MTAKCDQQLRSASNEELIGRLRRAVESGNAQRVSQLRDTLVGQNIGLVKSLAAQYLHSEEELGDLIQAGYIGLLNAAANFDLSRKAKFSTYAGYLIKGEIRHYIRDKHTTVRIPQWVQAMNRKS